MSEFKKGDKVRVIYDFEKIHSVNEVKGNEVVCSGGNFNKKELVNLSNIEKGDWILYKKQTYEVISMNDDKLVCYNNFIIPSQITLNKDSVSVKLKKVEVRLYQEEEINKRKIPKKK